jgi:hypothetical protein
MADSCAAATEQTVNPRSNARLTIGRIPESVALPDVTDQELN